MRTVRKKIAATAAVVLTAAWTGQAYGDFIFGAPTKVANVNGGASTLGGSISTDGLSLYFSSERAGGYGGTFDMYVATRPSGEDTWGSAMNLGPTLNGSTWEFAVNISPDGLSLMFSSDRPTVWGPCSIYQIRIIPMADFIGAGKNLAAGSFWSGLIDDVRIYNRTVKP